jgi:hypothetical protein
MMGSSSPRHATGAQRRSRGLCRLARFPTVGGTRRGTARTSATLPTVFSAANPQPPDAAGVLCTHEEELAATHASWEYGGN